MNRLSRKFKIILAVLGIILTLLIANDIYFRWLRSGELRTILDPRYVATAEYLFENPNPTPSNISIRPSPGETIKDGEEVCVYAPDEDFFMFTQFLINKKRLSIDNFQLFNGPDLLEGPSYVSFCFWNDSSANLGLDVGIHLFEIRLRKNPFHTEIQYEWAVRVEN
jgi:hypothetical protein